MNTRLLALIIFAQIALVACAPAHSTPPVSEAAPAPPVADAAVSAPAKLNFGDPILMFGDSLARSNGAHDATPVLENCLRDRFGNAATLAQNGRTSKEALELLPQVLAMKPKMVIMSLGGNDVMKFLEGQPISEGDTFNNLRTIYKALRAQGIVVLHMGINPPAPQSERLPKIKEVAESEGVVFLPDVMAGLWNTPSKMSDPVHPNDEGYKEVCERIAAGAAPFFNPKP